MKFKEIVKLFKELERLETLKKAQLLCDEKGNAELTSIDIKEVLDTELCA